MSDVNKLKQKIVSFLENKIDEMFEPILAKCKAKK